VAAGAAPEEVRAAYLQRVKEHPPERSPEMFEQIRDAYQVLSEPYRRAEELLLRDEPAAPLVDLLEESCAERRHVGPGPWLAVLRKEPGSTS
jgi:curved DNA-binding protein CbpA